MKHIFFFIFGLLKFTIACQGQESNPLPTQVPKDSIPKGIITLKDTVLNGNSTTLVVFHDDKGGVTKMIEYSEFPDYSPFRNLPFPKTNNDRQVEKTNIYYDLKNVSVKEREKAIRESGVTGVPIDYIKRSTVIIHHTRPGVIFSKTNNKFLLTSSYTELANYDRNDPSFCNLHISIYDCSGIIVRQVDINASGNLTMSSDARFLLCESMVVIPGYEYSFKYGPFLLYDLEKNTIDTITMSNLYDRDVERPSYSIYGDSFFQSMYISRTNPNQIFHILVDPLTKYIFEKNYPIESLLSSDKIDLGFEFISMYLPNGSRVNIEKYKRN